ncbi:ABC transporter ATP-binding protein [Oceanobacillus kapialis]|uniref:ABC transporter ATP-binding protein n=1 Tax=Oceanobacillus kapialis TaxID=481353 RepID=A0ABW5PWX8_9BACI
MKPVVRFNNVSKTYSLFKKKSDQLMEIFSFKNNKKKFSALTNVSFEVYKGETIGIIGVNGSGKSTLSNILAQIIPPTSGDIEIDGETSLVAISAGLNNFVSGMENIELKCLMHGMKKSEIEKITPQIIEFADLGEFINQPIKSYSSGMKSRLGFAISVHVQPDILVIDEALSVGDSTFYQKCLDKFAEFKAQGKTIFFISHSLSQVQSISDRIMWLNFGSIEKFDDSETVAQEYNRFIEWYNDLSKQKKLDYRKEMLSTQVGKLLNSGQSSLSDQRNNKKKSRWKRFLISFQFALIFFYFLIGITLMFVDNPVDAIKRKFIKENNQSSEIVENGSVSSFDNQSPIEFKEVDQNGQLTTDTAMVFQDENLEEPLLELTFPYQFYVEAESKDTGILKVNIYDREGYISNENIKYVSDLPKTDLVIEDFVSIFPPEFMNSYEFFFAFLNNDYENIKEIVQGWTNEEENQYRNSVLVYDNEKVNIIFDESNVAKAIEVKDISIDSESNPELLSHASLVSENEELFYILTEDFNIYIDIDENVIVFFRID